MRARGSKQHSIAPALSTKPDCRPGWRYRGVDEPGPVTQPYRHVRSRAGVPVAKKTGPANGNYGMAHANFVLAYTKDNLAHLIYPGGVSKDDWVHDLPLLGSEAWSRLSFRLDGRQGKAVVEPNSFVPSGPKSRLLRSWGLHWV